MSHSLAAAIVLLLCSSACQSRNQAPAERVSARKGAASNESGNASQFPYYDVEWHMPFEGMGLFSTGLALADVDGNGHKDIIVSNGNDMSPQPLTVYLYDIGEEESGNAGFADAPGWLSEDYDYHMGLCMGDINTDGFNDLVVTMPWNRLRDDDSGGAKVYLGNGSGFERSPAQRIGGNYAAMDCVLADVDRDGDLDLIVATVVLREQKDLRKSGPLGNLFQPSPLRAYLNLSGRFSPEPFWQSAPLRAGDIAVADVNDDGVLDLVVAAEHTSVFYGRQGQVPFTQTPSWTSRERYDFQYGLDVGRLDDRPELAIATSSFCLSRGRGCRSSYHVHRPSIGTSAIWEYRADDDNTVFSKLLLGHFNNDRNIDLIAGQWREQSLEPDVARPAGGGGESQDECPGTEGIAEAPLLIFGGNGQAGFNAEPGYRSQTNSVAQALGVADLRNNCVVTSPSRWPDIPTTRGVFTLPERHVEDITMVRVDGCEVCRANTPGGSLQPRGTCAGVSYTCTSVPGDNWVSISPSLRVGVTLEIIYEHSKKLDIVVADWSPVGPTAIYASHYHQSEECDADAP